MTTETHYKVRDIKTGLYSKGGTYVKSGSPSCWGKKGKTWTTKAALSLHLRQFLSIPDTWEIVEIYVTAVPAIAYPAKEWEARK
jgi:hypothetical protein